MDRAKAFLVLAIMLLVGAVAAVGLGVDEYQDHSQTLDEAIEVDATIIESDVDVYYDQDADFGADTPDHEDVEYRPVVEFEYEFEGEQYQSSNMNVVGGYSTYDVRPRAEDAAAEYPEGAQTTAYVHPDEPGEAFLDDEMPLGVYMLPAFGAVALVGSVVMFGAFAYEIVSKPAKFLLLRGEE